MTASENCSTTGSPLRREPDRRREPSRLRRPTALLLAAFSRGTAAAVRRLDDCVADDLSRSLAATD